METKALLDPPLQPLEPGSYDFARDLYFQGIGASGFARGVIKIIMPPASQGLLQSADAVVQQLRDAIDARIRAVLTGDEGAIAAMLINGRRDSIDPHLYDAMFVSGIGHVLSISGYHMAVVAGAMFFFIRAFLALIPGLADRAPIKKWAALAALAVTAFYLLLSGNQVATQRSFIMIAVVLVGVLFDRPGIMALSMPQAGLNSPSHGHGIFLLSRRGLTFWLPGCVGAYRGRLNQPNYGIARRCAWAAAIAIRKYSRSVGCNDHGICLDQGSGCLASPVPSRRSLPH